MPHCYPISITEAEELDVVWEGIHQVYSPLLQSSAFIKLQVSKMEHELRIYINAFTFISNLTEDDLSEKRRREIREMKIAIKHKRLVLRECEKKIVMIHGMIKRLSDPRPTEEQMEQYFDRKRQNSISEIVKNLQTDQPEAIKTEVSSNGSH